jgi:hypothetical protein
MAFPHDDAACARHELGVEQGAVGVAQISAYDALLDVAQPVCEETVGQRRVIGFD